MLLPGCRLHQGQRGNGAAVHLVKIPGLVGKQCMRKSKQERRTSSRVLGENSGHGSRKLLWPKDLEEKQKAAALPPSSQRLTHLCRSVLPSAPIAAHISAGPERRRHKDAKGIWRKNPEPTPCLRPQKIDEKGQVGKNKQDPSGK